MASRRRTADAAGKSGGRPAAIPPFRTLDPDLAVAERLLADGCASLGAVVAALPRERAAAAGLNQLLADLGASPRLLAERDRWRMVYVDAEGVASELVRATRGLAELVAVAGWRRVKRCEFCARPFIDRTNGCSRRWCAVHRYRSARGLLRL